ncbi:MAG TPA: glycoside hydrolase family 2 protein, partial [Duganella sp.]|uniref:glycoside hydrolase family 2 protein n=1 Tax=Duganella sp. TaxID=1904440 RepID=UPI002ED5A9D1
IRNGGEAPALGGKLTLLNADGERILPVYFSDNYVELMPGESRTVTATFKSQGAVRLDLRGWNVAPQSLRVTAQ